MRSRLSHGATLGTTLLVAALILLLGLTAASTGIFHLSFGTRVSRGTQAVEVADAAIALCLERLLTEEGFGEGDDPAHTVEVTLGDSVGRCTFSSAQAGALEVPRSLDNRSEEGALEGWGGRVLGPFVGTRESRRERHPPRRVRVKNAGILSAGCSIIACARCS